MASVVIPEVDTRQLRYSANDWVKYGDTNLFPDYLMKSVKKSPRHSRLIQLRENLIQGGGLTYSDNIKPILENLDGENSTVKELIRSVSTDLSILETFAVMVRYTKGGKGVFLDYVDSSKVRPSKTFELDKDGDPTDKVTGYWMCDDWSDVHRCPPLFVERFNPNKKGRANKQLYFFHKRANGQSYLPEVSYASCLNLVELDMELGKYALSSALNKFTSPGILSITATMTDEQMLRFKRDIDTKFTGADNNDSVMVQVSENENTIKFIPMQTGDNTPWMEALSKMAESGICTAHGAEPILAGIRSEGSSLGSDGKLLKNAQEHYQNTVITHFQEPILDFFKRIFTFLGIQDYQLDFIIKNLVSEDIPEWFLEGFVKPEVLATRFGFKAEDLVTPATENNSLNPALMTSKDKIPANPYPGALQ